MMMFLAGILTLVYLFIGYEQCVRLKWKIGQRLLELRSYKRSGEKRGNSAPRGRVVPEAAPVPRDAQEPLPAAFNEPWDFGMPADWEKKIIDALRAKWGRGNRPYNMTIFCPICENLMVVEVRFAPDDSFAVAACLCAGNECEVDTVVTMLGVHGPQSG